MSGVNFRRRPVYDRSMNAILDRTRPNLLHSTDFKYRFRRTLKRNEWIHRPLITIDWGFTYISSGLGRFDTGQRHELTGRSRIVVVLLFVSFIETRLEDTLTHWHPQPRRTYFTHGAGQRYIIGSNARRSTFASQVAFHFRIERGDGLRRRGRCTVRW